MITPLLWNLIGETMSSVKKKRKYKIAKHKRKKRSRRDRHKGR